jgi:hypothetical protein
MSLRDYFAAAALPTCIAGVFNTSAKQGWDEQWRAGIAYTAYSIADAMLAERERS